MNDTLLEQIATLGSHGGEPLAGTALLVAMAWIAAATLVSEDLTCIATGILVAQGQIGFLPGTAACFAGICIGDLLLFAAGRAFGPPLLRQRWVRRFLTPQTVQRSSDWIGKRGLQVVAASRFLPGTRLPTYFAAGVLRANSIAFTAFFALAAAIWTPLLVGLAAWAGEAARDQVGMVRSHAVLGGAGLVVVLWIALRILLPLFTWRGRRLLLGRLRRRLRWEFWPRSVFYLPILPWIAWLAMRHRSLRVAACANPGIPGGGLAGESKDEIHTLLGAVPEALPATCTLPIAADPAARLARLDTFVASREKSWPIVLKPDIGDRGQGVQIVRSREQAAAYLAATGVDTLAQEFISGVEVGILWIRHPGESRGRISSLCEKQLPSLRGDGKRTIEELILTDERALYLAPRHLARLAARLDEVPAAGAEVPLVEIGTHSRGSVFVDAAAWRTPELEDRIAAIADAMPGFFVGRFDIRAPSRAALQRGEGLRILEVNGITGEPGHIYDPRYGVIQAWRCVASLWAEIFAIGAANHARGTLLPGWSELGRLLQRARAASRAMPPDTPAARE